MGVGFAPTWLRRVTPMLHMTTLTTAIDDATDQRCTAGVSMPAFDPQEDIMNVRCGANWSKGLN